MQTELNIILGLKLKKTELLKMVRGFRYGLIGRKNGRKYCYIVCFPLQGFLSIMDIKTEIIEGEVCYYRYWIGHYWLQMESGKIIDPTADQFSTLKRFMPKVYIGTKPKWYRNKAVAIS